MHDLTYEDGQNFLNLATSAARVSTQEQFDDWSRNSLRRFLPFGTLLCTTGRLFGDLVVIDSMHGVDYPEEFMMQIRRKTRLGERDVIKRWLVERTPQIIDKQSTQQLSVLELHEFDAFALENIVAHGLIEPDGMRASYFSLSRISQTNLQIFARKLELVMPYLHQLQTALSWQQLKNTEEIHAASALTPRELEVLRWMLAGKSNAQIATILGRSANTIKHQVASVLRKLGAETRAQAAALAVENGIVSMHLG